MTTTSSSIVSPTGSRGTRSTRGNNNSIIENTNNTTSTNERCEYTTVCLPIVYGSVAYYLGKDNIIDDYHTHQWTLYVRGGSNNENLSVCISKVIFQLHPSFAQPLREVTVPPYEVTETGWGEFEAQIRIIWKDSTEQSIIVNHFIKLYPTPSSVTTTSDNNNNNNKINDNTTSNNINNQQPQELSQVSTLTTGSDGTISNNINSQEQQQETLSSSNESSSSISNGIQRVVSEKYDEIVFTNPHKSFFQQLQLLSKVSTIKDLYFEHEHFPMYSDTECFLKLLSAQSILQQELSSIKQKFIVTQNELQEIESSIIDATNALSTATEQQQQQQQQQVAAAAASAAAASKVSLSLSSSIVPGSASQSMMMNANVGSIPGQYIVPNAVMTGSIHTGASSTAAGVNTIHPSSMNPKPSKKEKISSMPPPSTTSGVASSIQLSNNNNNSKKGKSTTTGIKSSNTTTTATTTTTKKKVTKKSATQQLLLPPQVAAAAGMIPPTSQQQPKFQQQQHQQQIPMVMGTTAGAVATTGGGKKAIKAAATKAAVSGKVPTVATSAQQHQLQQPVTVPVVPPGTKSTTSNIPPTS